MSKRAGGAANQYMLIVRITLPESMALRSRDSVKCLSDMFIEHIIWVVPRIFVPWQSFAKGLFVLPVPLDASAP